MTKKEREEMFNLLAPPQNLSEAVGNRIAEHQVFGAGLSNSCEFGEGWVTAIEIDKNGLANAMRLGITKALKNLKVMQDEEIILDGKVNYIAHEFTNTKCIIDADALIPLVSAAGIYAKVRRDAYMSKLKKLHPAYGFEKHVGYGTAAHRLAIEKNGIIKDLHRGSFKPIQLLSEAS